MCFCLFRLTSASAGTLFLTCLLSGAAWLSILTELRTERSTGGRKLKPQSESDVKMTGAVPTFDHTSLWHDVSLTV